MRKVAFDHIAIGVPRIGEAVPFLVGELGGRPAGGGTTASFAFRQWTFGGGKLEVLEPAGADGGFLHRFLERRGAGVHHVTFVVPSLDAACAQAEELGFPVVARDDSDPEWKEAFLHPKGAMSIVVQLVEHRPSADGDGTPPRTPSAGDPEAGAPGIELVGLRLAARDLDRARLLWCRLLGGTCGDHGEELEVRWIGSALRLLVRSARGAEEEGPLSVEIACLRPAVLPRGPHPILGAVFEPVDITELPPPPREGEAPGGNGASARPGDDDAPYFLDGDQLSDGREDSG
jgi:hypothetical protein